LREVEGALQVAIGQRALGLGEKRSRVFERLAIAGGEASPFELTGLPVEVLLKADNLLAERGLLRGRFAGFKRRDFCRRGLLGLRRCLG
jgi:hypothetical protein